MMALSEERMAFRTSKELRKRLEEAAKHSGWSVSAQIRYQLEDDFGIAHQPYHPQHSSDRPSQDDPRRKRA